MGFSRVAVRVASTILPLYLVNSRGVSRLPISPSSRPIQIARSLWSAGARGLRGGAEAMSYMMGICIQRLSSTFAPRSRQAIQYIAARLSQGRAL